MADRKVVVERIVQGLHVLEASARAGEGDCREHKPLAAVDQVPVGPVEDAAPLASPKSDR